MKKADSIIIGFGKGGKTLAGSLASAGKSVIMVEKSEHMYGGTCINAACIPTKALVHSAELSAKQGGNFSEQSSRYAAAIAEKNSLTAALRYKNFHKLADHPRITVLTGEASLIDAHHVAVTTKDGAETLEADQIFLNTGARPFVPPITGLAESKRVYLSESLLNLTTLPRRLLIIGGGYMGLEFASMYTNFGSQVTIIQDSQVFLPREDAEVAEAVLKSLSDRGIEVLRSTTILEIKNTADQVEITVNADGKEQVLQAEAVLVATGRRPNVAGLNLEAAGVELTERGAVKTDEQLRTTAPNIWAMGDVVGGLQFTYISLDDFRIIKSQLMGDGSRSIENRGSVPYSVFLDPPFSRVGLTEEEAVKLGCHIKIATLPAAAIPKAQVLRKPAGLLKAIIDAKTDRILGAHLFCAESHEMINSIKLAIDAGLSYTVLRDAVYTHPTMSEAFNDLFAI